MTRTNIGRRTAHHRVNLVYDRAKTHKRPKSVIPANAGIQEKAMECALLDPRVRGDDVKHNFATPAAVTSHLPAAARLQQITATLDRALRLVRNQQEPAEIMQFYEEVSSDPSPSPRYVKIDEHKIRVLDELAAEAGKLHEEIGTAIKAGPGARTAAASQAEIVTKQAKIRGEIQRLQNLMQQRHEVGHAQALISGPCTDPSKRAHAMRVLEAALNDATATVVGRDQDVTRGMLTLNKVKVLELSNGLKVVWKPNSGEDKKKRRLNLDPGGQYPRAVAAYLIDKALGHFAGALPTAVRSLEGEDGCMTVFSTADKPDVAQAKGLKLNADALLLGAIFDEVIGNLDRHQENYLVKADESHVPIDHDLVLPRTNGFQGDDIHTDFITTATLPESARGALKQLVLQRESLTADLCRLKIPADAIEAMYARVEAMLERNTTSAAWMESSNEAH